MELQTKVGDCVLTSEHFREKQQWVYIVLCVYEQEREGWWRNARECHQLIWVEVAEDIKLSWFLQKVSQLPTSCQCGQRAASRPSVTPSAGSLFPLWCWGLMQLPGGLVWDTFISPSCQSRFTPTLLLLLIITIIIVWWERCAEHLGRLWCWFPCRGGKQCSSALWCDIQVSRNDQAF